MSDVDAGASEDFVAPFGFGKSADESQDFSPSDRDDLDIPEDQLKAFWLQAMEHVGKVQGFFDLMFMSQKRPFRRKHQEIQLIFEPEEEKMFERFETLETRTAFHQAFEALQPSWHLTFRPVYADQLQEGQKTEGTARREPAWLKQLRQLCEEQGLPLEVKDS